MAYFVTLFPAPSAVWRFGARAGRILGECLEPAALTCGAFALPPGPRRTLEPWLPHR
jgi:hypothetical protein